MTGRHRNLLQRLRDDTLDASDFTHADHLGVAWQALEEEDFFDALALFARGVRAAAARAGAADKFNATITLAYMSLIAERRARTRCRDADDFIRRNPDLGRPGLLTRWYSDAVLGSELARHVALMPDRVA